MSTRIKMCGMSQPQHIEWVNALQPEYIGYVFAKKSRRYVSPENAAKLTAMLSPDIIPVGVFVDSPFEEIMDLCSAGTIKAAQLHGNEPDELILRLQERGINVIRAFRIETDADIEKAALSPADFVLLDSGMGSGETFDHSLIRDIGRDYFLAGGLTAENVGKAIKDYRPFAVDASSSLETGGVKDISKMKAFADAVRNN